MTFCRVKTSEWEQPASGCPVAPTSSAVHCGHVLFALSSPGVGAQPLSLGHTCCGMTTFRVCRGHWARPAAFSSSSWLSAQGSKTSLPCYFSHNLWIQMFQKYRIFPRRHPTFSVKMHLSLRTVNAMQLSTLWNHPSEDNIRNAWHRQKRLRGSNYVETVMPLICPVKKE